MIISKGFPDWTVPFNDTNQNQNSYRNIFRSRRKNDCSMLYYLTVTSAFGHINSIGYVLPFRTPWKSRQESGLNCGFDLTKGPLNFQGATIEPIKMFKERMFHRKFWKFLRSMIELRSLFWSSKTEVITWFSTLVQMKMDATVYINYITLTYFIWSAEYFQLNWYKGWVSKPDSFKVNGM